MGEHKIIWTEKTWNVFTGCTKCSPGCLNCYAERTTKRLQAIPSTSEKYRNGFEFTFHGSELMKPLHWKKPSKIFVNSMSDTFHENADLRDILKIFEVIKSCPHHTFQILTKRPFANYLLNFHKNIQYGLTVCTQKEYDEKVPVFLSTPAHFHFLSIEPMLEPIDFHLVSGKVFDLVIVGGESGPGARPMRPDWVRSIRDQCKSANVPFLFKQWGDYDNRTQIDAINAIRAGRNKNQKHGGRILDGVTHNGKT